MKLSEIQWTDEIEYIDTYKNIWKVKNEDLQLVKGVPNHEGKKINEIYSLLTILELNFERYFDWNKLEIDTKVQVSTGGKMWLNAHFYKFEDNKVYVFINGRTSWTSEGTDFFQYTRLPKEE